MILPFSSQPEKAAEAVATRSDDEGRNIIYSEDYYFTRSHNYSQNKSSPLLSVVKKSVMKSIKIDRQEIRNYNWGERLPAHTVQYSDVINFERSSIKHNRCCVLCGDKEDESNCMIPKQNKGVCRRCDSTYWLLKKLGVVVKFCKGCKLFFSLADFDGKPNTTKCGTCRRRGRDNYHGKMERKRCQEQDPEQHCDEMRLSSDSDSSRDDDEDDDEGGMSISLERKRRGSPSTRERKKAKAVSAASFPGRAEACSCSSAWAASSQQCEDKDGVVALLLGMDSLRSRERMAEVCEEEGGVCGAGGDAAEAKEEAEEGALTLLLAAAAALKQR